MRPSRIAWLVCGIALAIFLALKIMTSSPQTVVTTNVASVPIGGAFTLIDQDGKTVTEKSWPNKYLLIYFGFTHCPDICPLGLSKMNEALQALPEKQRDLIQPILITVDPERDTPESLKTYVGLFNERLVGLTGTVEQIEHIKKLYRVFAEKQGDGKDYMVNHSGFTYFMTPQNELALVFAHETSPDDMTKQIGDYLKSNGQ